MWCDYLVFICQYISSTLFRLISMTWPQVAQISSSPMTTRRNTFSKYCSGSDIKYTVNDIPLTALLFASLVMQWRFVNRVLKQMTAFKEVKISSGVFIIYCEIISNVTLLNIAFFCLGILWIDPSRFNPDLWWEWAGGECSVQPVMRKLKIT